MSDTEQSKNRLLLEYERSLRVTNKEILGNNINIDHLEDLEPMIRIVAQARAEYLAYFITLTADPSGAPPSNDDIKHLALLHKRFEELNKAADALRTAIDRGYLSH